MPQDVYGNYYVNINPFPPQNIGRDNTVYGVGAPGSAPTFGQNLYVNTATGDCYASVNGVWVLVSKALPVIQME